MLNLILIPVEILTMTIAITTLSGRKLHSRATFFMLLGGSILGYISFALFRTSGILILLLFFIIYQWVLTKKVIPSVVTTFVVILILVVSSYFSQLFVSLFTGDIAHLYMDIFSRTTHTLLIFFITTIICYFSKRFFQKNSSRFILEKRFTIIIIAFLVLTTALFYFTILVTQQLGFNDEIMQLTFILFLMYTILLLAVARTLFGVTVKTIRLEREQEQTEQLHKYTKELEAQHKEIRKFRHDYHNIILTLEAYAKEDDMDGLKKYIFEKVIPNDQQIQSDEMQLGFLSEILQKDVKAILSNRILKAQTMNIKTYVDLHMTIADFQMNTYELSRVLSNLLDNAIEAAHLCPLPFIQISFMELEEKLHIRIKNSINSPLPPSRKMFQEGFSTKGEHRGLGLSIVKEIIDKNEEVSLHSHVDTDFFIQTLSLPN